MQNNFPKDISKYKVIISDVDGTLMGSRRVVSDGVVAAVEKWQERGKKFTIASGRSFYMLKDELLSLRITTPVIVRGGSEIVDPLTDKILYAQNIEASVIKAVMAHLRQNQYDLMIEMGDTFYSTYPYDVDLYPRIKRVSLDDYEGSDAPKINIPLGKRDIMEFERFANELINKFPELHVVRSYNDLGKALDVTSKSATKHLAVLELIKMLELRREETIGVGDGYNDIPLMEACGLKIAMGNARDELKEIADVIIPSHEEDGVAYLIEKLLDE